MRREIKGGTEYPYDSQPEKQSKAYIAARAVLYDLSDRRGIKQELNNVDEDIRNEKVDTLAEIIKDVYTPTGICISDIEDAIEDGDILDVETLIGFLKKDHPRYDEFTKALAKLKE